MKLLHDLVLATLSIASVAYCDGVLLHKPTGPYYVTHTQHVFNHTTLDDFTAPNGTGIGTILLASIFAPTESVPNQTVPYMDDTNAEIWSSTFGFPRGSLSTLVTELQWQAPFLSGPGFANGTSPYPTLIFMPGAGLASFAYTAYLSELASHGYSVIAIDHPGEPPYLELPYNLGGVRSDYPPLSSYTWTVAQLQSIYAHRVADASALLSDAYLPSLVRAHGLPINLTHIGIFGHSIGGAGSAGVLAQNPGVLAGANLDGWLFFDIWDLYGNGSARTKPYPDLAPRPFLELARDDPAGPDATWTNFSVAQSGWLRDVGVRGALHFDFSDVPLWVDLLEQRDGPPGRFNASNFLGGIDGRRVTEVVNTFLKGFFGYVSGGELEAVDGLVKEVPEAYVRESQDVAEVYIDRGL